MSRQSWDGAVFERLYADNPDPWSFESSDYERAKYAETLAALGEQRFRSALELGCSIGVMTAALAPCCDALLAVDIAETALALARTRCMARPQVRFVRCRLPAEFPDLPAHGCDLIVISELLYFLSPGDIAALGRQVAAASAPGALVLLVNWTGQTDTPCTGDEAATLFSAACAEAGFVVGDALRRETYRLDRLRAPPTGKPFRS